MRARCGAFAGHAGCGVYGGAVRILDGPPIPKTPGSRRAFFFSAGTQACGRAAARSRVMPAVGYTVARFESLTAHPSRKRLARAGRFLFRRNPGVQPRCGAFRVLVSGGRSGRGTIAGPCESGGIGRRTGFRFQRVTPVRVRVPPFAPRPPPERRMAWPRRALAGRPRSRSARMSAKGQGVPASRSRPPLGVASGGRSGLRRGRQPEPRPVRPPHARPAGSPPRNRRN